MREPVGGDDGLGTRNLIEDIHDATDLMLAEVAKEADRHLDDMALLLAAMKAKWKVDLEETGSWVSLLFPRSVPTQSQTQSQSQSQSLH